MWGRGLKVPLKENEKGIRELPGGSVGPRGPEEVS